MRRLARDARWSDALRDCRCGPCGTSRGSALRRSGTCRSRRWPLKTRLETRPRRPTFDRHIDIGRINLEPAEAPPGPLGCHERRSGAQKKIKHEIATPRHILDRIGNQPRRLDRRMQGQILSPAAPHGVYRGIVPNVGAVAAMPTEFDHVEMGRRSHPVDKDQFMLGPVKRSHPSIGLVPDAEVQALAVDGGADCRDAVHVSPVHADEVDGAIARVTRRCAKRVSEEGTELRLAHLTPGHSELAMASGGHRMSPNPHIVGRIEESRIDTRPVADDPGCVKTWSMLCFSC